VTRFEIQSNEPAETVSGLCEVNMLENIPIDWRAIVFPLMVISYFQLLRYLDRRYARKKPFTDQEYLMNLARFMKCSEYDIFMEAAKPWQVSKQHVEDDFKKYLLSEQIPYYVADFIRKVGKDVVHKNFRGMYEY
jgi:hypothetical protein